MRSRVFAVVLAAAVLAPVASADGPATHDLRFPAVQWKQGDVSQISGRLGFEVVYRPEFGKEDKRSKRYESDGWIASMRADEVDRDGVMTKARAWFDSSFISPKSGEADQSLGGALIDIERGRWTDRGGNSSPSRRAGRWLTDRFVKDCPRESRIAWLGAFEPGKKVAKDQEWTPDLGALAKHFSQVWDIQLDPKDATGSCKLESVFKLGKEDVASLWVELSFPIRKAPKDARGKRHPLTKDTRMSVRMQLRLGLAGPLPYREITSSGSYYQDEAKGDGSWKVDVHAWWGVKRDARLPEPKK